MKDEICQCPRYPGPHLESQACKRDRKKMEAAQALVDRRARRDARRLKRAARNRQD